MIHDLASATKWLDDLVSRGSLRNNTILLAAAWSAAAHADPKRCVP